MTRLRHAELAAFSSALVTLYANSDMPSLAGRVTQCLRRLFDCEVSSFDLIDLSSVRWNIIVTSPALPNWNDSFKVLQQHAHEHPILSHVMRHDYPHAIRTSDLLSLRQYRQLGIYQDYFRVHLMGMNRQMGFVGKPTKSSTFAVSINRRGKDFSLEQLTMLELLRPHLLQAYETAQAQMQLAAHIASERESIASVSGGGICQFTSSGRLEWTTKAVESLFSRYFPLDRRRADQLPTTLLTLLKRALHEPSINTETCLFPVKRAWRISRGCGTLWIHLASTPSREKWQLLLAEERHKRSARELAARHGLSKRESETLFWIGQGKANEEIALILSISKRTVEKYAERIFEKLNVYNRTAAVCVAMGR